MLRKAFSQLRELKTQEKSHDFLADNYMVKVNNRNMFKVNNEDTRTTPTALTLNNFSHLVLVFLLLNLNMLMPTGSCKLEFEISLKITTFLLKPEKSYLFPREFIIDLLQGRTDRVNPRLILKYKNKEKT